MRRLARLGLALGRSAQGLAVAATGAGLAALLVRSAAPGAPTGLPVPVPWAAAALGALGAHLLFGPKQVRPAFRRVAGAMYVYAGIAVDRQAGCRGGFATGATGSGKTLACILPRLHSLCLHEGGVPAEGWAGSAAAAELARLGAAAGSSTPAFAAWQAAARHGRAQRYRTAPWGGLVCGEKGTEWQTLAAVLRHHGREEDLCVLRLGSPNAPPPVRFNLLSWAAIPADTYAQAIVTTGLAVEKAQTPDEFFVPQARDKLAWGLRLLRALGSADPQRRISLTLLAEVLTSEAAYARLVAAAEDAREPVADPAGFAAAQRRLEETYWSQPPDQLGGVRSTIHNFLAPFQEPALAALFCTDSTFALPEIEQGLVVALALPQRFAVQRRYATALLKTLVYQVILHRFDRPADDPAWTERNVIVIEQDEWQRYALPADGEVDLIREAHGTTYATAQTHNAVWAGLGQRERAAPIIANLRNRWIAQAATDECAEESARLLGERLRREVSFTQGGAGRSTNVSFAERPLVGKSAFRTLPPFHVYFVPAEGPWLYKKGIAMPVTAEGGIPPWWFGDWNPLRWLAVLLHLPECLGPWVLYSRRTFVPPWRARAPGRAQWRRLWGLDGTFITLEAVSVRAAQRMSRRPR